MSVKLKDLPEFYVLVQEERKNVEETSLAGSSTAHLAANERLLTLKKRIAAESKISKKSMSDHFYEEMRKANRPLYR